MAFEGVPEPFIQRVLQALRCDYFLCVGRVVIKSAKFSPTVRIRRDIFSLPCSFPATRPSSILLLEACPMPFARTSMLIICSSLSSS